VNAIGRPVSPLPAYGCLLAAARVMTRGATLETIRRTFVTIAMRVEARESYVAFGNPLLLGASGTDKRAWDKQRCAPSTATRVAEPRGIARRGVSLRAIDLAGLRAQEPLLETADELCAVATSLGALPREADTMWLGERTTERNLKSLSRQGKLAHYKVLHFATHGLLAGESEAIVKARAEPAP
jgi:hypothetical protein